MSRRSKHPFLINALTFGFVCPPLKLNTSNKKVYQFAEEAYK